MTISTELKKPQALLRGLDKDAHQLIILPHKPEDAGLAAIEIGRE